MQTSVALRQVGEEEGKGLPELWRILREAEVVLQAPTVLIATHKRPNHLRLVSSICSTVHEEGTGSEAVDLSYSQTVEGMVEVYNTPWQRYRTVEVEELRPYNSL